MGTSYGADALSVLLGTHNPDEGGNDPGSLLGWFDLRPDGLYVIEKTGVEDAMVDAITGDFARRRKAGLPLLNIPFSSKQFAQFEAAYGGLFSSLLGAGEDTPALLEDIRDRNSDAAELAEVLLGLRDAAESTEQEAATTELTVRPDPTKPLEHRVKWQGVVREFVIARHEAGQFGTAKDLYLDLEKTAGEVGSPFSKGTGNNRDKLFVKAANAHVSLKTFQNNFSNLLEG